MHRNLLNVSDGMFRCVCACVVVGLFVCVRVVVRACVHVHVSRGVLAYWWRTTRPTPILRGSRNVSEAA
jgi:hypothetical protein